MFKCFIRSAALAVVMLLSACIYNINPVVGTITSAVEGTVVDVDTDLPIAGANVVVIFPTQLNGFLHSRGTGVPLRVIETVTDEAGHFHFSSQLLVKISFTEYTGRAPSIFVFKPDYGKPTLIEAQAHERRLIALRNTVSDVKNFDHRKRYALKRYSHEWLFPEVKPYPQWRPELYSSYRSGLDEIIRHCLWDEIPKMTHALATEAVRVRSAYPNAVTKILSLPELALAREANPACNSAVDPSRRTSK